MITSRIQTYRALRVVLLMYPHMHQFAQLSSTTRDTRFVFISISKPITHPCIRPNLTIQDRLADVGEPEIQRPLVGEIYIFIYLLEKLAYSTRNGLRND